MRIDRYTKTTLTLIVLLLAVLAVRPIFQPSPVQAQNPFNGIQFSGATGGFYVVDTRTGDIWVYASMNADNIRVIHLGKFVQAGKPLVK